MPLVYSHRAMGKPQSSPHQKKGTAHIPGLARSMRRPFYYAFLKKKMKLSLHLVGQNIKNSLC